MNFDDSLYKEEWEGNWVVAGGDLSMIKGPETIVTTVEHALFDEQPQQRYMVVGDPGRADATMRGNPELGLITSSALGFAMGTEHADLVRRILAQGGSVEERYSTRMTPLQNAITVGGSAEVIQLLLEEGADPNAVGNYETMLDATFDFEEFTVRTDALALLLEFVEPKRLHELTATPARGADLMPQSHDHNALIRAAYVCERISVPTLVRVLSEGQHAEPLTQRVRRYIRVNA